MALGIYFATPVFAPTAICTRWAIVLNRGEPAKAIADGPSICQYVVETADENAITEHIRFKHHVTYAAWSSKEARWAITALVAGEVVQYTCNVLYMNSGYYDYDEGFTPKFTGIESFKGTVIHPQFWPENLDYTDKRCGRHRQWRYCNDV